MQLRVIRKRAANGARVSLRKTAPIARYVVIASQAFLFSDISPVDGIIVGSPRQKLGVAVDVLLVE